MELASIMADCESASVEAIGGDSCGSGLQPVRSNEKMGLEQEETGSRSPVKQKDHLRGLRV